MQAEPISGFFGEHRFLSNFWPAPIRWQGIDYPTVEHAYQAAKTEDIDERRRIAALASPGEAKRAGRGVTPSDDWARRRLSVMRELLALKFEEPALRARLLATGGRELVETNDWGDRFWGRDRQGNGGNLLGELLMRLRYQLGGPAPRRGTAAPGEPVNQRGTAPEKPRLTASMYFSFSPNSKRPELVSRTCFEAVQRGERTSTTRFRGQRGFDRWAGVVPGDLVRFYEDRDCRGEFVEVRVTGIEEIDLASCSDERLEAWSRAEGWTAAAGRGFGAKNGKGIQIHYALVGEPRRDPPGAPGDAKLEEDRGQLALF